MRSGRKLTLLYFTYTYPFLSLYTRYKKEQKAVEVVVAVVFFRSFLRSFLYRVAFILSQLLLQSILVLLS